PAAEHPLAGTTACALDDPPRELIGRAGVAKVDADELVAAGGEVDVRVVESGQRSTSAGVDDLRRRTAPARDLGIRSDGDDAVADDRDGLRVGTGGIAGPDGRVREEEIGGAAAVRRAGGDERSEEQRGGQRARGSSRATQSPARADRSNRRADRRRRGPSPDG